MGANSAGIYGAQLFRSDDKPRYRRGFSINIAILALAVILAAVRFIDDRRRRRNANHVHPELDSEPTIDSSEKDRNDTDGSPERRQRQSSIIDTSFKAVVGRS